MKKSTAVFSGKVIEVRRGNFNGIDAVIEVSHVWKGKIGKKVIVRTATSSAACGYRLLPGFGGLW